MPKLIGRRLYKLQTFTDHFKIVKKFGIDNRRVLFFCDGGKILARVNFIRRNFGILYEKRKKIWPDYAIVICYREAVETSLSDKN